MSETTANTLWHGRFEGGPSEGGQVGPERVFRVGRRLPISKNFA